MIQVLATFSAKFSFVNGSNCGWENIFLNCKFSVEFKAFSYDFIVKIAAGETFKATASTEFQNLRGVTRQIAALDETLTNP